MSPQPTPARPAVAGELELLQRPMEMSRERLLATLDAVGRNPGWSPDVLRVRGRDGGPHLGWHLAHVASIEDLWAHRYFASREPSRPDLVARFFRGTTATDDVPAAGELLAYLDSARRDLLACAAALPGLDHSCTFSDGRVMAARDVLALAAVHESIHHGRIAALYFDSILPTLGDTTR